MTAQTDGVLEFIDESSGPDGAAHDDVVDVGRDRRVPHWLIAVAVAVILAIAAVVVARGPGTQHQPRAAASTGAASDAPAGPTPSVVPMSYAAQTLLSIYRLARDSTEAHDIVRSGSDAMLCKTVQLGTAPQRRAAVELTRALPGYTLIDAARTIDQGAGLCDLQVRAGKGGTVAVLMVTSPTQPAPAGAADHVQSHATTIAAAAVAYTQLTTKDGWTVVIGTSGPKAEQPTAAARDRIALSPAVRW